MRSPSLSAALASGSILILIGYIGNERGKSPVSSTVYTTSVVKHEEFAWQLNRLRKGLKL
jgi:hypothetical protein